jgi:hypothetical protein
MGVGSWQLMDTALTLAMAFARHLPHSLCAIFVPPVPGVILTQSHPSRSHAPSAGSKISEAGRDIVSRACNYPFYAHGCIYYAICLICHSSTRMSSSRLKGEMGQVPYVPSVYAVVFYGLFTLNFAKLYPCCMLQIDSN